MVKSSSLQSDLEFIKEYEELKIKQKLLIETLNKKKNALKNDLLVEIASKLDFLVKIFQEASKAEAEAKDKESQTASADDVKAIIAKLDELKKINDEKFEAMDDRISSLMGQIPKSSPLADEAKSSLNDLNISSSINSSNNFSGNDDNSSSGSSSKGFSDEFKSLSINTSSNSASSLSNSSKQNKGDLPPIPDFANDQNSGLNNSSLENKTDSEPNFVEETEKKKKKWF